MVTFRNNSNNNRRNSFRRNEAELLNQMEIDKNLVQTFQIMITLKEKAPGRNYHNSPKLIEKYNDLAREALSNGDKILSENYLQHADHFTRILNERESIRKEKFLETNTSNNNENNDENIDSSKQKTDKELIEKSSDEPSIQKNLKSQVEVN